MSRAAITFLWNCIEHFLPSPPSRSEASYRYNIQLGKQYESIMSIQQALIGPMTCTLASCRISASGRHALVQKARVPSKCILAGDPRNKVGYFLQADEGASIDMRTLDTENSHRTFCGTYLSGTRRSSHWKNRRLQLPMCKIRKPSSKRGNPSIFIDLFPQQTQRRLR
jgi:hypothetical protein